jgi:hypothetical protein
MVHICSPISQETEAQDPQPGFNRETLSQKITKGFLLLLR